MALAVCKLHFQTISLQLSVLRLTFPTLCYAANETQIRLERMAYLTLRTLAFDGGRLCDGGHGICRCSSTDTPRHQGRSYSRLNVHNPPAM